MDARMADIFSFGILFYEMVTGAESVPAAFQNGDTFGHSQ